LDIAKLKSARNINFMWPIIKEIWHCLSLKKRQRALDDRRSLKITGETHKTVH